MTTIITQADPIIQHLIRWAEERPSVRAAIWTSSRVSPHAPVDRFSDYDVILAVTDVRPFFEDRGWLEDFGPLLVVYRDPIQLEYGLEAFAYITQYEDGTKIDFTLWTAEIARRVATQPVLPDTLDVGYTVLLDKDGLVAGLRPPTYRAHVPSPPDETAYRTLVEVFFHEATYVAKHLWRGDLLPAKYNLDQAMKQVNLRRMLEWRIEIDHDWSLKPGAYGKGLQKRLPPALWAELERTYVGAGTEENWEALFRTIDLFRKVAVEVASGLGYAYPHDMHRHAVAYLERVRRMERQRDS